MSSSALHRLLYVSRALIDACGPEPRRILDVAVQRNAAEDVTGLLCFSGDHFAQVLEGPAHALDGLMRSIRADPRHRLLREWPARSVSAGQRWFPTWSMGYLHDQRLEAALPGWLAMPGADWPLHDREAALFASLDLYGGHLQEGA